MNLPRSSDVITDTSAGLSPPNLHVAASIPTASWPSHLYSGKNNKVLTVNDRSISEISTISIGYLLCLHASLFFFPHFTSVFLNFSPMFLIYRQSSWSPDWLKDWEEPEWTWLKVICAERFLADIAAPTASLYFVVRVCVQIPNSF